jgi:hypothetical protein
VTGGRFLSERHRTFALPHGSTSVLFGPSPYHASFCSPASASVEISG